jgi:hypothetical protein
LNSIAFYASPDFVPEGEGPEERNQDSDDANAPEGVSPDVTMAPPSDVIGLNEIYFGEVVSSWRQVLKRFTNLYTVLNSAPSANRLMLPLYPFEDISGTDGGMTLSLDDENLFAYICSAFVCVRGGTRVKVHNNVIGSKGDLDFRLTRTGETTPIQVNNEVFPGHRWCGTAIDALRNKPYAEFELPVYSNLRFTSGRNYGPHTPGEYIERAFFKLHAPTLSGAHITTISYAAAEDFSLYFFLSTPIILI